MKIVKFSAQNVHGYLNLEIDFNRDVSILVGSNGSGKTSCLLLIQALLAPNFVDLFNIPFSHLNLILIDDVEVHFIRAESVEKTIRITSDHLEDALVLDRISSDELEYILTRKSEAGDLNEEIYRRHSSHPVLSFIRSVPSPVFLGLERRDTSRYGDTEEYIPDQYRSIGRMNRLMKESKRLFRGSLGVGLMETEILVQNTYKRIREIEDSHSNRLQDEILLSSFEYFDFEVGDINREVQQGKYQLINRKGEIIEAVTRISNNKTAIVDKINIFFAKLNTLFELPVRSKRKKEAETESSEIRIEYLTNKAQIERIARILAVIDEHNTRLDRINRPLDSFVGTINSFISDSRKSITLDKVGRILVSKPDGTNASVESLSSGERQLLIIFAHIFFSKYDKLDVKSDVFIIDEPELSLHIKWQEEFIPKVLEANPNLQFILATHSPDIVGNYEEKCINPKRVNNG